MSRIGLVTCLDTDPLLQAVQDLFTILEERQIDYVLAGDIAILYYIEGRNSQHLELLMAVSSLEQLPELEIIERDMYFVRAKYGELQIDIPFMAGFIAGKMAEWKPSPNDPKVDVHQRPMMSIVWRWKR
jgi:hypothetical protein